MKGQTIIKQGDFMRYAGVSPPGMGMLAGTRLVDLPSRSIDNGEIERGFVKGGRGRTAPTQKFVEFGKVTEYAVSELEPEPVLTAEEQERHDALTALEIELEQLREECDRQCLERIAKAEEVAAAITANAEKKAKAVTDAAEKAAKQMTDSLEAECAVAREEARRLGYADGNAAGEESGYAAGEQRGYDVCKETLTELCAMLTAIPREKEQIFKEHEAKLFDLIFTICNKVTAKSLTQKDKSVIANMLKEAAKGFRNSNYIKVSLSKHDIDESANVDLEDLAQIFGDAQQVEFEVLKDAPKGTLILDNGSEITDAGIDTQLKMIKSLGEGKFKNKEADDVIMSKMKEIVSSGEVV